MSGEKKRLEQYLLQTRASNILLEPTFKAQLNRFAPKDIDRIRLLQAQRIAGQVPVSEALKKQVKKRKKKARKTKQLRGDLARNLTEQRRFTRGERREKDTEEPRIVGDPAPVPAGFAYDPAIERRRLDIEEARDRQRQLERIADRREEARRQDAELAVRRGELAAGRADRALIRAAPPPPAPVVNIAPAPVRVDVAAPRVDVAPVINVPPALPARADADPIPEIQRLGAQIRADRDAFGAQQDERNRDLFSQLRQSSELESRQIRESIEAIDARQQAQDETRRVAAARQDAINQELQVRLGLGEASISRARDDVIQEFRNAEDRLRRAQIDLDRPTGFDDVILAADRPDPVAESSLRRVPIEEVDSPTPLAQRVEPEEPEGIGGVIAGGGELNLPNVVVEQPGRIGPDESLRLSPQDPADRPGTVVEDIDPITGRPRRVTRLPGTAGPSGRRAGGGGALRAEQQEELSPIEIVTPGTTPRERQLEEQLGGSGSSSESLQFRLEEEEEASPDTPLLIREPTEEATPELDPVEPVNVADALRLSRLAIDQAEPVLQEEEEDEAQQARLRLVDTQDFLAGFERPASPRQASPLVGGGTAAERLEGLLAQPSPVQRAATPTPRPEQSTPSTPEEEEQHRRSPCKGDQLLIEL